VDKLPNELPLPESMVPDVPPDPPATPRDAATVVLLRDGAQGFEAFLLRRVNQMAFAGGMTVFPGGGVDKRDADAAIAWAGPDAEWWADRFRCDVPAARALVCAAVRETFEESGVLLAGPSADSVVADATSYGAARKALVDRELSFAEFLEREQLVLRADLLRPWGHWITPAQEPRRFDTRFFVAALPAGQRADGDTSEADHAAWQRPSDALTDYTEGRNVLLPPTWTTLAELAAHANVGAVMAVRREFATITPKIVRDDSGLRLALPGSPLYAEEN
jgi:8-oxo-dGTP pyrophosphatase MutT (NUDIX family)